MKKILIIILFVILTIISCVLIDVDIDIDSDIEINNNEIIKPIYDAAEPDDSGISFLKEIL